MTAAATTTQEASLAALNFSGNRYVRAMRSNAPARCPFFRFLSLDKQRKEVKKSQKKV